MSLEDPSPDDVGVLAGEYALGLVEGAELAQAERRLASEAGFAEAVEIWRGRFAALAAATPAAGPPDLWPAIARRLEREGNVVEFRLKRAVAFWRAATGIATAAAAALIVAIALPRPQPPAAPVLAARLTGAGGAIVYVAVFDARRNEMVLTPASVTATPGRSPELWLMPPGRRPIALGLARYGRSVRLRAVTPLGGPGRVTLGVSLEPVGGSPTGQPTGPVLATGRLERL